MRLVSSFEAIDASGQPVFSTARTILPESSELAQIEHFLNGGQIVMATSRKGLDAIQPERGRVVPMIFRTDGEWVWSKSLYYYLAEHSIPIEEDFLKHIRGRQYSPASPDEQQVAAALRLLQEAGSS